MTPETCGDVPRCAAAGPRFAPERYTKETRAVQFAGGEFGKKSAFRYEPALRNGRDDVERVCEPLAALYRSASAADVWRFIRDLQTPFNNIKTPVN